MATKRRVLAVDDEPRLLDIVKYYLETGGYEVHACGELSQALQAASRQPFDAVVLDIVLEKASGYDVAGELKRIPNTAGVPILFMSSKVGVADLFLKSYDGRAEFIQKPFKKEDFLSKIALLIDGGGRQGDGKPRKSTRLRKK